MEKQRETFKRIAFYGMIMQKMIIQKRAQLSAAFITENIWIIAVMLLIIALPGCGKRTVETMMQTDIHSGGRGIELNIITETLPNALLVDSNMVAGVEVRNMGAHDIGADEPALIYFYTPASDWINITDGFDANLIGDEGAAASKEFIIEGKSLYNSKGGYDLLEFEVVSEGLPRGEASKSFVLNAKACYPYETFASVDVCINPNLYSPLKLLSGACKVKEINLRSGQGAPVAVTKVTPQMVPDKDKYAYRVNIEIENVGNGIVTNQEDYSTICKGETLEEDKKGIEKLKRDSITVKLGRNELRCTPPKEDEEYYGRISIMCWKVFEKGITAYTTPMTIGIEYGYVAGEVPLEVEIQRPDDRFGSRMYHGLLEYFPIVDITGELDPEELLPGINDGHLMFGADRGGRQHEGIDIMAEEGTRIIATVNGVVKKSECNDLGGWTISIEEDGTGVVHYYAHLKDKAALREGSNVKAGDVIGLVGTTLGCYEDAEGIIQARSGRTESHLHYGIYVNDDAYDPFLALVTAKNVKSG